MKKPLFRDNPHAYLHAPRQAWDPNWANPIDSQPVNRGTDWQDLVVLAASCLVLGFLCALVFSGVVR